MQGRIIGPPVPVIMPTSKGFMSMLAVAVEIDAKKCIPAFLPEDVYPTIRATVKLEYYNDESGPFQYYIVKD